MILDIISQDCGLRLYPDPQRNQSVIHLQTAYLSDLDICVRCVVRRERDLQKVSAANENHFAGVEGRPPAERISVSEPEGS